MRVTLPGSIGSGTSHTAWSTRWNPVRGPDRARDIVWTLIAPEVYQLLVGDRGWSADDYEQWLAQTLTDTLATPGT